MKRTRLAGHYLGMLLALLVAGIATGTTLPKPTIEWNRYAGRLTPVTKGDQGSFPLACVDAYGNSYVGGEYTVTNTDTNGTTLTEEAMVLTRINPDETIAWDNPIVNPAGGVTEAIACDALGNAYMEVDENATQRNWLEKVNAMGKPVWNSWISQSDDSKLLQDPYHAKIIKVAPNGLIYVIGTVVSTITGTNYDILQINPNGGINWSQIYTSAGNNPDIPKAACFDSQNNLIVTGTSVDPTLGPDITTIKYAPDGTREWVKFFSDMAAGGDEGLGITTDGDNYYVVGTSHGTAGDMPLLIKYDANGNQIWVDTQPTGGQAAYDAVWANTNTVYVGGNITTTLGNQAILVKYNNNGAQQWNQKWQGSADPNNVRFISTGTNGEIFVGCDLSLYGFGTRMAVGACSASGQKLWMRLHPTMDAVGDNITAFNCNNDGTLTACYEHNWDEGTNDTIVVNSEAGIVRYDPQNLINPLMPTATATPANNGYVSIDLGPPEAFGGQGTITASGAEGLRLAQTIIGTQASKWTDEGLVKWTSTAGPTTASVNNDEGDYVPPAYIGQISFNATYLTLVCDEQDDYILITNTVLVHTASPVINQQPISEYLPIGTNAEFTVGASGIGTLHYQWFFNGIPINAATNATLHIYNISPANNGPYTVEVSDNIGQALSQEGRLIVYATAQPMQTAWQNNQTLVTGDNADLVGLAYTPQTIWEVINHTTWDVFGISTKANGYTVGLLDPNGNKIQETTNAAPRTAIALANKDNKVWILSQNGTSTELNCFTNGLTPAWTWTTTGNLPAEGLTVDKTGTAAVLFGTTNGSSIATTIVTPNGQTDWKWGTNAAWPIKLTWTDNRLAIAANESSNGSNELAWLVGSNNVSTVTLSETNTWVPTAITSDTNGNTYVATELQNQKAEVVQILPNGKLGWTTDLGATDLNYTVTTLAITTNGDVLCGGNHQTPTDTYQMAAIARLAGQDGGVLWERTTGAGEGAGSTLAIKEQANNIYTLGTETFTTTAEDGMFKRFSKEGTLEWTADIAGSQTYRNDTAKGWTTDELNNEYVGINGENPNGLGEIIIEKFINNPAPILVESPSNTTVSYNGTLQLSCTASGTPPLNYQWLFNNNVLINATNSTLTITNMQSRNAGNYLVEVSNGYGNTESTNANVSLSPLPVIEKEPADITSYPELATNVSVVAAGAPPLQYQWYYNGNPVAGGTAPTLILNPVGQNLGKYYATIMNTSGSVTTRVADVTLKLINPPTIVSGPTNASCHPGQSTNFVAQINGEDTKLQWWKDGKPIGGATNTTWTINNAGTNDEGTYLLIAQNYEGSVTSTPAIFTLTITAPKITKQPPYNMAITNGGTLKISVTATGDLLNYQWQQNGTNIPAINNATAGTSELVISNFTGDLNAGKYQVEITNRSGGVLSYTTTVTRQWVRPTFIINPTNCTTTYNGTESFFATAVGDNPITYQWYRSSGAIPNATNTDVTVTNITKSEYYWCRASNPGGTTTSRSAYLRVNGTGPTITNQPSNITTELGKNFTISVGAKGDGTLNYQWYRNNTALMGATANYMTLTMTTNRVGTYKVRVWNTWGSVFSSNAIVNVLLTGPTLTLTPDGFGGLYLNILGQPGETWKVQSSSNLMNWTTFQTNTLDTTGSGLIPITPNEREYYYRTTE